MISAVQAAAGAALAWGATRPWLEVTVSLGGAPPRSDLDRGTELGSGRALLAMGALVALLGVARLVIAPRARSLDAVAALIAGAALATALVEIARQGGRIDDLVASARALGGSASGRLRDGPALAAAASGAALGAALLSAAIGRVVRRRPRR